MLIVTAFGLGLFPGPPPAEDFIVRINITISNASNTQGNQTVPSNIGVPGGIWQTHTYDNYGLDGHYPVYADPAPQYYPGYAVIHVRSKVVHQYTLGDFFNLWGWPLGQNLTLNRPAAVNGGPAGYQWWMCTYYNPNSPFSPNAPPQQGLWKDEILLNGKSISLVYGNTGCMAG